MQFASFAFWKAISNRRSRSHALRIFTSAINNQLWALLGSQVLRHLHRTERPQTSAEYLRYIHANPKAAGVRKGFYDPYSNYGHDGRLACDGISEWHPSFVKMASSLKGCSRRYERFCQKYRHHAKGGAKCHWGSRMLKRLVGSSRSKRKRVSPGQQQLPFVFDVRLNQIPEEWHQVAVRFRRANGIRDGDRERRFWSLC